MAKKEFKNPFENVKNIFTKKQEYIMIIILDLFSVKEFDNFYIKIE